MTHTASETALIEIAKEYFRRVDAGGAGLADLFTDDIELYFPKFGVAKGMDAFGALAAGLFTRISRISHDMDSLLCVANGDDVIIEGMTRGAMQNGSSWAGGHTPGGRFCNVFHFRDGKIDRVHIHLDPDYGGLDSAGFLWGTERTW